MESNVDNLTAENSGTKAGLAALRTEFTAFKTSSSHSADTSPVPMGGSFPVRRGSFSGAPVTTHRMDAEAAKCELILANFGGPLTHDTISRAYKDWAAAHLPQGTPMPKIKSRRIDESAKLVFETSAQAKTVLDAHDVTVTAGEGISFGGQAFKMKLSRPFRQRRLNDHMGGVKFKISKLNADNPLSGLSLVQDNWQWEASFEQGCVSGGKLFYLVTGRPQIVAKLSLDANAVGVLTSTDNCQVFPSEDTRTSFKQLLKEVESEANSRARG